MGVTIAGLARAGGVGVETVRYYQRRGLMPTPDGAGGVRLEVVEPKAYDPGKVYGSGS